MPISEFLKQGMRKRGGFVAFYMGGLDNELVLCLNKGEPQREMCHD